jgi:trehalose-6-phosphatase
LTYQHADSDFLICAGDDKTDEVSSLADRLSSFGSY